MFKKLISILKLCPKSGLKHSVDHAQGIGMKFKICFFRFFLVEIWFKNDISIKNMSCLTLNPTSVNNHNAQYAHKHAISTQRGVTTGETQREKNNGENDANCEMSFCEKPPCPKICFAKIWFPQGCVCENPGYPGPWFAKDQGQIFLKRFAIVKLFVATCAHILINEENNIFLRKVGFLKHAGHKSVRLIAKWQLDNIYVEPLVCEEPGPGSSQTGC